MSPFPLRVALMLPLLLPLLVMIPGAASACRLEMPGTRCVTADSANVDTTGGQDTRAQAGPERATARTITSGPQAQSLRAAPRTIAGGARLVPARPTPEGRTRSAAPRGPQLAIGSTLPDDYMILLNTDRYGLPAPRDGWAYFRVEGEVYRVMIQSREVLERVTDQTNAAF